MTDIATTDFSRTSLSLSHNTTCCACDNQWPDLPDYGRHSPILALISKRILVREASFRVTATETNKLQTRIPCPYPRGSKHDHRQGSSASQIARISQDSIAHPIVTCHAVRPILFCRKNMPSNKSSHAQSGFGQIQNSALAKTSQERNMHSTCTHDPAVSCLDVGGQHSSILRQ